MTRIDQSEGEKIRLRRANEKTFFSTNVLNFIPSNGIVANLDESRIRKTNNLKKLGDSVPIRKRFVVSFLPIFSRG